MILIGDWHTEDIGSEHLSFSVFSTGTRSQNSCRKKMADKEPKEYLQSCKEQF